MATRSDFRNFDRLSLGVQEDSKYEIVENTQVKLLYMFTNPAKNNIVLILIVMKIFRNKFLIFIQSKLETPTALNTPNKKDIQQSNNKNNNNT